MLRQALAALGLAVVPAACSGFPTNTPDVQAVTHPIITVRQHTPPELTTMQISERVHVSKEPDSFHATAYLWRWIDGSRELVHIARWHIYDLPPVGTTGPLAGPDWECIPGRYYSQWIISGVSDSGDGYHYKDWYPYYVSRFRAIKPGSKAPTYRQSWKVTC